MKLNFKLPIGCISLFILVLLCCMSCKKNAVYFPYDSKAYLEGTYEGKHLVLIYNGVTAENKSVLLKGNSNWGYDMTINNLTSNKDTIFIPNINMEDDYKFSGYHSLEATKKINYSGSVTGGIDGQLGVLKLEVKDQK